MSTGYDGDLAYLSVEDTGPGIPVAERIKVLERFYRIAGTPGDGSGLGLAIVKEVVDRLGGGLEINGSSETGGSCIRVTFSRIPGTDARFRRSSSIRPAETRHEEGQVVAARRG